MQKFNRETFEEMSGDRDFVVTIEDGRMGLCTHWDDDWLQIEAYKGNEHECIRVPWGNLINTKLGVIVGLKGAIRNADQ